MSDLGQRRREGRLRGPAVSQLKSGSPRPPGRPSPCGTEGVQVSRSHGTKGHVPGWTMPLPAVESPSGPSRGPAPSPHPHPSGWCPRPRRSGPQGTHSGPAPNMAGLCRRLRSQASETGGPEEAPLRNASHTKSGPSVRCPRREANPPPGTEKNACSRARDIAATCRAELETPGLSPWPQKQGHPCCGRDRPPATAATRKTSCDFAGKNEERGALSLWMGPRPIIREKENPKKHLQSSFSLQKPCHCICTCKCANAQKTTRETKQ